MEVNWSIENVNTMKKLFLISFHGILFIGQTVVTASEHDSSVKPRVIVTSDGEIDDVYSMIRFLLYSNEFDIEGLAATTSIHQQKRIAPERIRQISEANGKVRDNLEKHEAGFPAIEFIRSVITEGLPEYGMSAVTYQRIPVLQARCLKTINRKSVRNMEIKVLPNILKNRLYYLIILTVLVSCSKAKISVSDKQFPPVGLVNHYEYFDGNHMYNQLGTAFLLKYQKDIFAITAKHILAVLKPDSIKNVSLENFIRR